MNKALLGIFFQPYSLLDAFYDFQFCVLVDVGFLCVYLSVRIFLVFKIVIKVCFCLLIVCLRQRERKKGYEIGWVGR